LCFLLTREPYGDTNLAVRRAELASVSQALLVGDFATHWVTKETARAQTAGSAAVKPRRNRGGGVLMLDKQDSRRQRNPRPNGLELPIPGPAFTKDVRASRGKSRKLAPGIRIERSFTRAGDNGYAGVIWEQRTASIVGEGGKVVFEQRDV
jgi:hypothetical protein